MTDLSNAEISVEGEYGVCIVCGESFHWEQLTNTETGSYCDNDAPGDWVTETVLTVTVMGGAYATVRAIEKARRRYGVHANVDGIIHETKAGAYVYRVIIKDVDDGADYLHDTALERATFGNAI